MIIRDFLKYISGYIKDNDCAIYLNTNFSKRIRFKSEFSNFLHREKLEIILNKENTIHISFFDDNNQPYKEKYIITNLNDDFIEWVNTIHPSFKEMLIENFNRVFKIEEFLK